ncbi:hypothetical protein SARC_10312 [Sphaeroforma arctica JP610]|uniref:Fe2OG dioxygenase domain-containing protein n=1 Tax=Sphaeroforma arctica JP610 TaxID=667725 RepID=A0A0L0FKC3_9EUKA|nr:hypothetical protein SARC_10312 [Sphaeroforma arctica JP610]KNC77224.1 hypothetical protein SARC_10312 [Sphaeroforma arctica JP610]|eukprot:XP_014151126.1 hypothetical protein SARC_10312 [Sphaeroforma arctica JP610]
MSSTHVMPAITVTEDENPSKAKVSVVPIASVTFPPKFEYKVVSKSPRIATISNLLTTEEMQSIIAIAKPRLKASRVVGDGVNSSARSSTSCRIPRAHKDVMSVLRRLSEITGYSIDNFETIQVVHYDETQEYKAHNDWFNPNGETYASHMKNGGQRLITIFCYLNDVTGGGETCFPKLDLKFAPHAGHAVLWYNRRRKDEEGGAGMDDRVLHAGTRVTGGEKWGMNVWIRERKYIKK